MKTLSLLQPWGSLVACGAKCVETRSWSTSFRGPIAIHASASWSRDRLVMCFHDPFQEVLLAAGFHEPKDLPLGCVLAVCNLTDCRSTGTWERPAGWVDELSEEEFAFGNYDPGRFGWVLENVRRLETPVPARGMLGLWEWDASGVSVVLTTGTVRLPGQMELRL